jgi:hypothetical protein
MTDDATTELDRAKAADGQQPATPPPVTADALRLVERARAVVAAAAAAGARPPPTPPLRALLGATPPALALRARAAGPLLLMLLAARAEKSAELHGRPSRTR